MAEEEKQNLSQRGWSKDQRSSGRKKTPRQSKYRFGNSRELAYTARNHGALQSGHKQYSGRKGGRQEPESVIGVATNIEQMLTATL